jgi:hypothetical protein
LRDIRVADRRGRTEKGAASPKIGAQTLFTLEE